MTLSSSSVTTGALLKLISTSTVSNGSNALSINISGANSTPSVTIYGLSASVSNTGTTNTNISGFFKSTGGVNNLSLVADAGGTTNTDVAIRGRLSNGTSIFDVSGDSTVSVIGATLKVVPGGGGNSIKMTAGSNNNRITCDAGANFYINTGGADQLFFQASQNRVAIRTTSPTSTFTVNGSLALTYIAKTANYTLTESDYLVNCTSNSFTITLPTAVNITGRIYIVKNTGTATTITIVTNSSQTIDGSAPTAVTGLTPLRIMSDGANWITI